MRAYLFLLSLLLVLATGLFAQAPVGQVFGVVRDTSGLVVPNVSVIVEEQGTGQRYQTTTNEAGDFLVRALPPGEYSVAAESQGFKKAVRQGITVTALQNVRVDLTLEVGPVSQSVLVTADAPQVDTRSGTVGALIDEKRIVDLPLSGRNLVNTFNLAPGVTNIASANNVSYNQQRVNINGNRIFSTNMQLDGGSMYYAHRGQGLLMPPPDAVEEIKVISAGMTAEYGRGTVVMSAVTKSGTNEFHGSLWDYFRNDNMDARKFFDLGKAKLRYNQFGGTIGGPILKNRLFFFGAYQGLRVRQDTTNSTPQFPPTAAERTGDFTASNPAPIDPLNNQPFPNRAIPQNRMDPVALKLVARMPLPNAATGRLASLASSPVTADDVIGKFDYTLTPSNRLSFRFYMDYQRGLNPFPNNGMGGYAGGAPNSQDMKVITLNYVRVWSPTLLSTMRGSVTRFVYDELNSVNITLEDLGATNFPVGGGPPRLPFIDVSGRINAYPGRDQERAGNSYDFAQDWSWQRGRHEFKWGTETQPIGFNRFADSYSSGRFTFDGAKSKNAMADLMLGTATRFTQNSNSVQGGIYYIPAFYVQDTWKATSRLTLTLGLRWEIYTAWRDDQGQLATYIPGAQSRTFSKAPLGMIYQTDPQFNYNTDWVNIGPRIGFAWDVFGDGKTSIRGGYATSYDGIDGEAGINANQPFSLGITNNNPGPLSNPFANMANPFPYVVNPKTASFVLPASPGDYMPNGLQAMYNHNFNLTIQRQLSSTWSIQTGYLGNFARKQLHGEEGNAAVYGPGATTKNTDVRRPLAPLYTGFTAWTTDANSAYNAWQTIVTKRLANNFSFVGHYTWSKAIDTCTNEVVNSCGQQDPSNRNGSRALGDYHRTHSAVVSYIYGIPFFKGAPAVLRRVLAGWQLAGIHRLQTGVPVTVNTGSDASLTGVGNDRPNVIHNPALPSDRSKQQKIQQWFDPTAFVTNPVGRYGNAGRNIIIGPGLISWDLSVNKDFPLLRERQKLQFRTDFLNIMNHVNLGQPVATLASPGTMGVIGTQSGSARILQLALRMEF